MPVNNSQYPSWGDSVHVQSRMTVGKRPEGKIVDIDSDQSLVGVYFEDDDERVDYHDMDFVGMCVMIGGGIWCLEN